MTKRKKDIESEKYDKLFLLIYTLIGVVFVKVSYGKIFIIKHIFNIFIGTLFLKAGIDAIRYRYIGGRAQERGNRAVFWGVMAIIGSIFMLLNLYFRFTW